MYIRTSTANFRPTTLAAMISDMINTGDRENLLTVKALLDQLETTVGEIESIDFLVDAGVGPEDLIDVWELTAA